MENLNIEGQADTFKGKVINHYKRYEKYIEDISK